MKEAISKETVSDPGHSRTLDVVESNSPGNSLKSAAMLGIALSVGASGALVHQSEASASVPTPTTSATTTNKAFSSDSQNSASTATEDLESSQLQIVAYHTVASGESLWQIAQQHQVGLRELKSANNLPPETSIRVGQVLRVPASPTSNGAQASVPSNLESSSPVATRLVSESAAPTAGTSDNTLSRSAPQTNTLLASEPSSSQQTSVSPQVSETDSEAASAQLARAATAAEASRAQISSRQQDLPSLRSPNGTVAESASLDIQIADASVRQSNPPQPVVTALAAPTAGSRYQVQAGDTLGSIASAMGTTPEEIIRVNRLANPDVILAGSTLVVPTSVQTDLAKKVELPSGGEQRQARTAREQLAHLQSSAVRPEGARLLSNLREVAPQEAASVGGEPVTERDLLASNRESPQNSDPYVSNLLEEVREIRGQQVEPVEVASSEIESDRSLVASADRPSMSRLSSQRLARTPESSVSTRSGDAQLLAAAPLSPDAYVPAQRSSAGQVVSPDMPMLPSADEFLPEAPNYFNGYIWPTQGTVTSGFGWRWGRMHRGVDVAGPVGTPVVAAAAGVVEEAGWNSGGYGNMVEIRHSDGSMTRYAHNNRLLVSSGQSVRQGEQIAEMGSTGYSTGPHLHFEVVKDGEAVNPVAYLPAQ